MDVRKCLLRLTLIALSAAHLNGFTEDLKNDYRPGTLPDVSEVVDDADDPVGPLAPREKGKVVGNLALSMQWISDRTASLLYISAQGGTLSGQEVVFDNFSSRFGSRAYTYPSLDYFTHLFSFSNVQSSSWRRNLSIWARYSMGLSNRKGQLSNPETGEVFKSESSNLVALSAKVGAYLSWDALTWVRPFAGVEIDPYAYRHTSSLSRAEAEGNGATWGPAIGAHFPIPYVARAALLAEFRHVTPLGNKAVFAAGDQFGLGLGLAF